MSELSETQSHFLRTYIADFADPEITQMFDLNDFSEGDFIAGPDEIDPSAAKWAQQFAQLDPEVVSALSWGSINNPGGLRATWALAVERGTNGMAAEAIELIPRVKQLLADKAETRPDAPPQGHVEFMQLVLQWQAQKAVFERQLNDLSDALVAESKTPDMEEDSAPQRVRQVLNQFNQGLSEQIEAVQNAAFPPVREREAKAASDIAVSYLSYVESDPLVAHLRQNPYGIEVDAMSALGPTLRRIVSSLGTVN